MRTICIGGSLIRLIRRIFDIPEEAPPPTPIKHYGRIKGVRCKACGATVEEPVEDPYARVSKIIEDTRELVKRQHDSLTETEKRLRQARERIRRA